MSKIIQVPLDWKPRPYQEPAWKAFEQGKKRGCLVWHRRAGKDLWSINFTATRIFQRVGIYWHVLPTYRQGRQIVWEGKTYDGRSFLSHFPEETIVRKRDDEMTLWFSNGSRYQVIGADEPDRLVGANPIGVILSEWSLMSPRVWELIWPILAENDGYAIFIYTPRGRNHGYKTLKDAQANPNEWFSQVLGVNDTGAVDIEVIEQARQSGIPKEMIEQEFHCSFDAPLAGAYYGDQMTDAHEQGRIGTCDWDPMLEVGTGWDLGIGDKTAIWFYQQLRNEIRFIDYYESSGVGIEHYAKVLKEKPYHYQRALLPHDAAVREFGSGKSRTEMMRSMGIPNKVVTRMSVSDGINAVRAMLPRCYFDEKRCEIGIRAMQEYTKERIVGEQASDGSPIYRDKPKHDWTSHPADAIRTIAVGIRPPREKRESLAPRLAIV